MSSGGPGNPRRPRLAYLTTAYPSISHTFIRREILGLERLGYSIVRIAIRAGTSVVDPEDVREDAITMHLLSQPKTRLLRWALWGLVHGRLKAFTALRATLRMSRASERGIARHLAYFVEALAMSSFLRARNVEHVHVHFGTNAAAVAMLVKHLGGPGFSMTIHGPDEFDAAIGLSLRDKMREAAFTVAISNYCSAQLQRWADPRDWPRIHVVPCTVGDEWFQAAQPIEQDSDTFVSVGRLSAQKGQLLLVDSFASAAARGMQGNLVLVGDGELRAPIQARIDQLGMAKRIVIVGWCSGSDVRKYMLSARALVVSSFAEGLPVVIMEAMALERPIVATNIMGIPELVLPGAHGWLAISGDRESLTEALLAAAHTSTTTLREMGRSARLRVAERHAVNVAVHKLDQLFVRVVFDDRHSRTLN